MPTGGKYFELLDFPKFARPTVVDLNAALTAQEVARRIGDGGFMSYGPMWPRVDYAVRGLASDDFIRLLFSYYKEEWKNLTLRQAFTLLRNFFGGRGRWYPQPSKPIYVLGFWFKPSIKGVWFVDGRAYAVSINARKGQPLSMDDIRFLARGVHELHCVDDPNNPIPLIVDLSAPLKSKERVVRSFIVPANESIPLEAFEHSVHEFLAAMNLAGIALPPPPDEVGVIDLFKRR